MERCLCPGNRKWRGVCVQQTRDQRYWSGAGLSLLLEKRGSVQSVQMGGSPAAVGRGPVHLQGTHRDRDRG